MAVSKIIVQKVTDFKGAYVRKSLERKLKIQFFGFIYKEIIKNNDKISLIFLETETFMTNLNFLRDPGLRKKWPI